MPGKRGARFQPKPTSKTRSAVETGCEVFVTKSVLKPLSGTSHEERVFLHLRHYTRSASLRRLGNALLADPAARFVLHAWIVAKAGEPVNAGILAEPCNLALCVAP